YRRWIAPEGCAAKSAAAAWLATDATTCSLAGLRQRKAMRLTNAPVTNDIAPSATCAVVTSTFFSDQIVAAPSALCTAISPTHTHESRVKGFFQPSCLPARRILKITAENITTATKRWTICSPI